MPEISAQNIQRIEPNEIIQKLTNKFLVPSNKSYCYKEVLRYIVIPTNSEPESAICLQISADSSFIELITFKESISNQVMIKFIENSNDTVFKTATDNYSIAISSELSNKLTTLINYLIDYQYEKKQVDEIPLDGTSYLFCVFEDDKTKTLMFHSSAQDMLRNRVIRILSNLSNHIKAGQINEYETIAAIDKIFNKMLFERKQEKIQESF